MRKNKGNRNSLTQKFISTIPTPEKGAKIYWEDGLGLRVTSKGKRSFVYKYYFDGRPRTYTIGPFPAYSISAARDQKNKLAVEIKEGLDPLEEKEKRYKSPTLHELADHFMDEHVPKYCRPLTEKEYKRLLDNFILPLLGKYKCIALKRSDIKSLHNNLSKTPYQANRCLGVVRKILNYGMELEYLGRNVAMGIKKFPESKRERWLDKNELNTLINALRSHENQRMARVILLLIYTGARKSEVLGATWDMFNLDDGLWTKPSHHTKQKRLHHIPLNLIALEILKEIRNEQETLAQLSRMGIPMFVFPGDVPDKPLQEIKRLWDKVRKNTELTDIRLHDLRHTYASHLVSNKVPLQIVGQLLGHTEMQTTMRYAHLADSALKEATDCFEQIFSNDKDSETSDV